MAAFLGAAEAARRLAAPVVLARAALGFETVAWRGSGVAQSGALAAALVREALQRLPPVDSLERAGLLAARAGADLCNRIADAPRALELAVAMARRIGDMPDWLFSVARRDRARALGDPTCCHLRLAAGREAMQCAERRLGNPEWAIGHLTGWQSAT